MNKECLTCKKSFYVSPSRGHIKNCSYECNKVWRKLEQDNKQELMRFCKCGCETLIRAYGKNNKEVYYVFGHSPQMAKGETNSGSYKIGHPGISGDKAPNWRGGVSLMRNGYLQIRVDGRRVYLHRLIAEQKEGRLLTPKEQVHHIDHDKLNNSPDNLVVLTPEQHARYHSNVMWGNLTKGDYNGL